MGVVPSGGASVTEIRVHRVDVGIYVIELIGDHGFHNAKELAGTLLAVADQGGCVVLDLSGATFVDSTVIREIVLACGRSGRSGQRLRVQVRAGGPIERTLQLMLLDSLVPVVHTRLEALAAP